MTLFWILAAGLTLLAVLFIAMPILRGLKAQGISSDELNLAVFKQQTAELEGDLAAGNLDQAQYEAARRDLEKELLQDVSPSHSQALGNSKAGRWAVIAALIGIPLISVPLYMKVGNQTIIGQLENVPANAQAENGTQNLPPMDQLVEKLAERLRQDPNNAPGWIMLARSYLAMGDSRKALDAMESAMEIAPDQPDVLLGYAEMLAKSSGTLKGRPAELIAKALSLDPQNGNALWMSGMVAYDSADFATAASTWEKLQAILPADSEDLAMIKEYIADARSNTLPQIVSKNDGAAGPQAPAVASAAPTASEVEPTSVVAAPAGEARIRVSVDLDPALKDKVSPTDRVFIFARAQQGPRMPLAAIDKQAQELPLTVELTDAMAMMPQARLSMFQQVVVGARISKTGSAMPQSGDLQAELVPASPGQEDLVNIRINQLIP